MESIDEHKVAPLKRNNLNTKHFPPLFTLLAGLITMIICLMKGSDIKVMLLTMLISMVLFAFVGLGVKMIVDNFDMKRSYDDILDDDEDEDGEIFKK
jgi:hypothetical protein